MNITNSDSVYCRQIGSLPKPERLVTLLQDQIDGLPVDAPLLEELALSTMQDNIARQIRLGYPLVVSGEADRASFFHHILRAVTGLERVTGGSQIWLPADLVDFSEVAQATYTPAVQHFPYLRCTGRIMERDPEAVYREIALYKRALAKNGWPPERAVLTEPSLGTLANLIAITDSPYKTRQDLIAALGQVMRHRYHAVIDAGFILSVDLPDALMRQVATGVTLEQFLATSDMQIAILNEALAGLPLDRVHAHACYGNYAGTDTRDEPLRNLAAPLLKIHAGTLFLEGSLSRHRDDYLVLKELLDAGMVPATLSFGIGVIDTKYFSVEDEQEVAHRIVAMRRALGSRLVACSPDCGYETMTGITNIPPSVVWAKNAVLPKAVALANSAIAQMEAQVLSSGTPM
jgi:5-methyltetrahydropteroyltriglutamate--homocysteine methyltransferase